MFDIVRVNGQDMAATYHYGDALLVKKFMNTYQAGDVVYLEYPAREDSVLTRLFFFQRLAGLPGDSLEIIEKKVYRNRLLLRDSSTVKHNYFIRTRLKKDDALFESVHGITEGGSVSSDYDYCYSLTDEESERLQQDSMISRVTLKMEKKNNFDQTCFPWTEHYKWNMDQYGSLYIPKLNDTIYLDSTTIKLYYNLIAFYEKNRLELRQDSILINGQPASYYVVKKNYYFVMGDNRDNANDSRVWGFLPDNFIVGKVIALVKKK